MFPSSTCTGAAAEGHRPGAGRVGAGKLQQFAPVQQAPYGSILVRRHVSLPGAADQAQIVPVLPHVIQRPELGADDLRTYLLGLGHGHAFQPAIRMIADHREIKLSFRVRRHEEFHLGGSFVPHHLNALRAHHLFRGNPVHGGNRGRPGHAEPFQFLHMAAHAFLISARVTDGHAGFKTKRHLFRRAVRAHCPYLQFHVHSLSLYSMLPRLLNIWSLVCSLW